MVRGHLYLWVSTVNSVADSSIVKWLKENPMPQQQYSCVCCIWQLSFEEDAANGLDKWVSTEAS